MTMYLVNREGFLFAEIAEAKGLDGRDCYDTHAYDPYSEESSLNCYDPPEDKSIEEQFIEMKDYLKWLICSLDYVKRVKLDDGQEVYVKFTRFFDSCDIPNFGVTIKVIGNNEKIKNGYRITGNGNLKGIYKAFEMIREAVNHVMERPFSTPVIFFYRSDDEQRARVWASLFKKQGWTIDQYPERLEMRHEGYLVIQPKTSELNWIEG